MTSDEGSDFDNWTQEGLVGSGNFGVVVNGRLRDGTPVAVKMVDVERHFAASVRKEVDLLCTLRHTHIVKCLGHKELSKQNGKCKIQIFMERCKPLYDVWTDRDCHNNERIRDYTRQIILGLKHLHDKKIAHHDLKMDNVLIGEDGAVKLADFGCSKAMSTVTMGAGGRFQPIEGTPSHMAPEIIAAWSEGEDPHYGAKADIWALGCLVLELHGRQPWTFNPECYNHPCAQLSSKFKATQGFPENGPTREECPQEMWEFFTRVFERDPTRRADCAELLDCNWLKEVSPTSQLGDLSTPHGIDEGLHLICHEQENALQENSFQVDADSRNTTCQDDVVIPSDAVKCFTIDVNDAAYWSRLGSSLRDDESARVGNDYYTKPQCYVRCLEMDKRQSDVWYFLGSSLRGDKVVRVDGESFSKQQCYLRCLEIDNNQSEAWYFFGTMLRGDETVRVDWVKYSKVQCFARCLEIDSGDFYAWLSLGSFLRDDEVVKANGVSYSKQQCYVRCLEIDESYATAWYSLGKAMRDDEVVRVKGDTYTKPRCFARHLEIDEGFA